MNTKIALGVLLVVIIIGAVFVLRAKAPELGERRETTYTSSELGFAFDYPTGPDGYALAEVTPAADTAGLVRSIVLVPSAAATEQPPVGGEGPATITINVFTNAAKQWPQTWADEYIQYSNINLKQNEIQEAVVGGANAIRYMADGLYASENIVVAHGAHMYVFSGMFLDADSQLRKDFAPLIESVRFIPAPGQE